MLKNDVGAKKYNLRNLPRVSYNDDTPNCGKRKRNLEFTERPIKKRKIDNNTSDDTYSVSVLWDEFNTYDVIPSNNNILEGFSDWVSATKTHNYLLKDPVLDWIALYHKNQQYNDNNNNKNYFKNIQTENKSLQPLFDLGNKFEKEVFNSLRLKYPNSCTEVINNSNEISKLNPDIVCNKYNKLTLQAIKSGTPIIFNAPLYNLSNKTYGVADILVRSDFINKIFNEQVLFNFEENISAENLNGNYHYVVIDVKWKTLYINADGKTIRNQDRFPAYKGQLAVYNASLGLLQGYTPSYAFILGNSCNINNIAQLNSNCFDMLGRIDYQERDTDYILETKKAINWIRNVRLNGKEWELSNPTIPEMYPNMCNKHDNPYHFIKKNQADSIKELTSLWQVGYKNRKIAHDQNIFRWDDPNCSADTLGFKQYNNNNKELRNYRVVNKLIEINRDSDKLVLPTIISNNSNNWKRKTNYDFYIDFETCSYKLYDGQINLYNNNNSQILFCVGIYYQDRYTSFIANNLTNKEEERIVDEYINFINKQIKRKNTKIRLFHWGNAEKTIMESINKKYNNKYKLWIDKVVWIDMCKIFMEEPIVVKGSLKFNLKSITNALNQNNLISISWPRNGPSNGLDAMIEATNYYRFQDNKRKTKLQQKRNDKVMQSIIEYNKIDCCAVYEIVKYLRENNT